MENRQIPEEYVRLGSWCLLQMAYWGELSQRPESIRASLGSAIDEARQELDNSRDDPLLDVNIGSLAWRAIASAGEHVGLAHYMYQSSQGGVVPRPHMSLARSVMLCAARTVYLLGPEDPLERKVRAAKLANQEVIDARRNSKIEASIPDLDETRRREAKAYWGRVEVEARAVLNGAGLNPASRIKESDMLIKVAPLLADGMGYPEAAIRSAWSRNSGVSHGRSWVWAELPYTSHPTMDFVEIWSLPVGLLGHAWRLWNIRRGLEEPPAYPSPNWKLDPRYGYRPGPSLRRAARILFRSSRSWIREKNSPTHQ